MPRRRSNIGRTTRQNKATRACRLVQSDEDRERRLNVERERSARSRFNRSRRDEHEQQTSSEICGIHTNLEMGLGQKTERAKRSMLERAKETAEQKKRRKEANRERSRWIRANESEEERQKRMAYDRVRSRMRRACLKRKRIKAEQERLSIQTKSRRRRGDETHEVTVQNEPLTMIANESEEECQKRRNHDRENEVHEVAVQNEPLSMLESAFILEDTIKVEPSFVEDYAQAYFSAAQETENLNCVLLNEAVARASCAMEHSPTEALTLEDAIKVEPSIVEDDEP